MSNIIFFGNQKLVQGIKHDVTTITDTLKAAGHKIIATVTTKEDLETIPHLLKSHKDAIAVLASFGYIIPESTINLFSPLGILNIHPSLLPKYRGPTPIETAIHSGDHETGVSIMQLSKQMDSGPLYLQQTLPILAADDKFTLATKLTALGAKALIKVLDDISSTPLPQTGTPTYTQKLDKSLSKLSPSTKTSLELDREIRAYLGFPKSKYTFYDTECTILSTHPADQPSTPLDLKCTDNKYLIINSLQPASRSVMSASDFLRGYAK